MSNEAMLESSPSTGSSSILKSLRATVGDALVDQILTSKLLLVGAGGIGCELLKNLALCGFSDITVVDLDTIDVSNLNRQLLFRSQHVGQPKCVVACEVASQLAVANTGSTTKDVKYVALHGNVCDNSQFHVEFVKPFALILNALDNVVARRRVNRLALAANVPLIEAGTTGYLGQVTTIHKASGTACYECTTQETGKVYPICTIRSTPSAPVHCIVWAKELYKLLFHDSVQESMLYEDVHGAAASSGDDVNGNEKNDTAEAAAVNGNAKTTTAANGVSSSSDPNTEGTGEPSTYMESVLELRKLLQQQRDNSNSNAGSIEEDRMKEIALQLVRNLYVDEIQKQLDMDRYKTAQKKPIVLDESAISASHVAAPTTRGGYKQTDVWSTPDCVAEFVACCVDAMRDVSNVLQSFDKDDMLAMRLVTATSNLRSTIFGIEPLQSFYSAKGIAGNIIPAIATTNAIVAGLQILQCFNVLQAQIEAAAKSTATVDGTTVGATVEVTSLRERCAYINCVRNATRNGLFFTASHLEPPNPKCFVCAKAVVPLSLNVTKWTLADFITKICKGDLGFENPSIAMENGGYIWEEGDDADSDEFAVNLPKLLPDLPCGGIHNGTVIAIEDFSQDLEVQIAISHVDFVLEHQQGDTPNQDVPDDHKFVVGGTKPKPVVQEDSKPAAAAAKSENGGGDGDGDDDDDDIVAYDNNPDEAGDNGKEDTKKRASTSELPESKKQKLDDVIEIDD